MWYLLHLLHGKKLSHSAAKMHLSEKPQLAVGKISVKWRNFHMT